MIDEAQLKKMILQNQINQRQMIKADHKMHEVNMQKVQLSEMMQQHQMQQQLMDLETSQSIINTDTPAARELLQIKQLLAQRERPQMPLREDMTNGLLSLLNSYV